MSLVERFVQQVRQQPESIALTLLGGESQSATDYTWLALGQLVCAARERLRAAGRGAPARRPGEAMHIATWLPNGLAWIVCDLAIQSLGWVHVAIDQRLPAGLAAQLIAHSHARLVVQETGAAMLWPAPADWLTFEAGGLMEGQGDFAAEQLTSVALTSQLPAQILYTSGTVSRPKGVVLSHGNLESNALAKLDAAPQYVDDVRLNVLPFAHAYARTCELSTWIISGSRLCIASDWPAWLSWAPVVEPTLVNLVPHLANKLARLIAATGQSSQGVLGTRMRLLQVGGATLARDVWERLAQIQLPPLQGYGLTETSPVLCSNRTGCQRPDSVGWPVAGVDLRVDQAGVLWTRGPQVMLGYWDSLAGVIEPRSEPWFCTGDLATIHGDGSVQIHGRADDQILLSTGYKVAPLELTQLLAADPWVESLVLIGSGRPYLAGLVYPDWNEVPEELRGDRSRFSQALVDRWHKHWNSLPPWMRVERIAILDQPLTVASGGLNFKGGLRRKHIEFQLCADLVAQIYQTERSGQ